MKEHEGSSASTKQMDRIEDKLISIENKLNNHLDRLSKAESSIEWLKGFTRVGVTFLLAALGSAIGYIFKLKL